jgi:uncharacterized protein (TIGR03435 family)
MTQCLAKVSTVLLAIVLLLNAQSATAPSFDVASVKPNNSSDGVYATFPLGPGDVYVPNGSHFTATNYPLITYIFFAYKIMGNESQEVLSQLPGWVTADRFDIQARTDGDPVKDTKDQMRLMMRALLADRFRMATHYETRQIPVFGLMLVKPGKMGPQLQPHPADSCSANASPAATVAGGYPALCGGLLPLSPTVSGRVRAGARNVTMAFIANLLAGMGNTGRPVLDQTGLIGTFDFRFRMGACGQ